VAENVCDLHENAMYVLHVVDLCSVRACCHWTSLKTSLQWRLKKQICRTPAMIQQ